MEGRQQARDERYDEAIALAWHVAALDRADPKKPLPSLSKLLKRKTTPKERQTPDDMLEVFRAFHAAGAPMTITRID